MKIKSLLLAAFAVASFSASATDVTDVVKAENKEVSAGQEVVFNVMETSTDTWCAIGFDVVLPGVEFVEQYDEEDESNVLYLNNYDGAWKKHSFASAKITNGIRVVGFSLTNRATTTHTDAVIGSFKVKAPATAGKIAGKITAINYGHKDKAGSFYAPETTFELSVTGEAVNDVTTAKEVASVTYYNVAGMESAEPFAGVNIMVTTFADGSKTTAKVVK